jgi:ribosomal-protein-alanine N-acetyltransferase
LKKAKQKLQSINEEIDRNESITWGIALKKSDKLVGTVCFWNISEKNFKAEIGYELLFDYQGKGIMQEAIKPVIRYGFEKMKLACIEAFPIPNHTKSISLLEKNGFIKERTNSEMIFFTLKHK